MEKSQKNGINLNNKKVKITNNYFFNFLMFTCTLQ